MKAFVVLVASIFLFIACSNKPAAPTGVEKTKVPEPAKVAETEKRSEKVDLTKLAGRSAAEFDGYFGKATKISPATNPIEKPGEYRQYEVTGNPKGLSVRFFKDRAVRFNLFVEPGDSARKMLKEHFGIDVGNSPADTKSEPLSEKFKGKFSGVEFLTIYAKRDKPGGRFVMVHAETVR